MAACRLTAQNTVSGTVSDGREPLVGANVFILGTIDGCLSDSLGRFSFTTEMTGEVTLRATYIGYDDFTSTVDVSQLTDFSIRMSERATTVGEVVVTASTFSFGKSEHFSKPLNFKPLKKTVNILTILMKNLD